MKPKQSTVQDWGGKWTEVKLNSFIEYVRAYLTILNKYPHYKSIYFDGFAGLGEKITTKAKKTDLFNFEVNDSELTELHVYQGSTALGNPLTTFRVHKLSYEKKIAIRNLNTLL